MDDNRDATRCKQCDHLLSFHGEDGCGTWLLGVRAVPLYRCACVVSVNKDGPRFPTIPTSTFLLPAPPQPASPIQRVQAFAVPPNAIPPASVASTASASALKARLLDIAADLRRMRLDLEDLERRVDRFLQRVGDSNTLPTTNAPAPVANEMAEVAERRRDNDRRRKNYAMIADRRVGPRRKSVAA